MSVNRGLWLPLALAATGAVTSACTPLHYRLGSPSDPYSYMPLAAPAPVIVTSAIPMPAAHAEHKVHRNPRSKIAAAEPAPVAQASVTTVNESVPLSLKEDRAAAGRSGRNTATPGIGEIRPGTKLVVADPQARQTMDEARKLFREGEVTKARVRFNTAVSAPLGLVLLELGRTFDPNHLGKLAKSDVEPNVTQARTLYEQAVKLGAAEARQEMQRLPAE